MALNVTLALLQQIFPNLLVVSAIEAGKVISLAPQTVKNQVSTGSFPIPTYLIGGKRICKITEIADYIDTMGGKRPGRPKGSTKAVRLAAAAYQQRL